MFNRNFKKTMEYIKKDIEYCFNVFESNNEERHMYLLSGIENLVFQLEYINKYSNDKQKRKFKDVFVKEIYCKIGHLVIYNEKLKEIVFDFFHFDNNPSYYEYHEFVLNIINNLAYRAFNYPELVDLVNQVIEKVNFTDEIIENYLPLCVKHYQMLASEPIELLGVDNTYDKEKSEKLTNALSSYLKILEEKQQEAIKKEQERKAKELEDFKKSKYRLDANIKTINSKKKYSVTNICEYSFTRRNYKGFPTYHTEYDYIRLVKSCSDHELLERITLQADPFAVVQYVLNAIDGQAFDMVIMPNIEHVLNNVSYVNTSYVAGVKGNESFLTVVAKYLMYYFGVGYEKDLDKAEQYLMMSCDVMKNIKSSMHYIRSLIGSKYVKLLLQYDENIEFYKSYRELYECGTINEYSFVGAVRYLKKIAEEKGVEELCLEIDKTTQQPLLYEALTNEFASIYFSFKEKQEQIRKQEEQERLERYKIEQERKEKRKEAILKQKERLKNQNLKGTNIESRSIEELKQETDDAFAMFKVADYYFDQKTQDRMKYLTAYKYYSIAAKLGAESAKVNQAICYYNLAGMYSDEQYKSYMGRCIEILKEYAYEDETCAVYLLLVNYKIDKSFSYYESKKLLDHYLNKEDINKSTKNVISAAYYISINNYDEFVEQFEQIFTKLNSVFLIGVFFTHMFSRFIDSYNKAVKEYDIAVKNSKNYIFDPEVSRKYVDTNKYKAIAKKLNEYIDWGLELVRQRTLLDFVYYYYKGNIAIEQNKKKAFEILKQLDGYYYESQEQFEKIYDELALEFKEK